MLVRCSCLSRHSSCVNVSRYLLSSLNSVQSIASAGVSAVLSVCCHSLRLYLSSPVCPPVPSPAPVFAPPARLHPGSPSTSVRLKPTPVSLRPRLSVPAWIPVNVCPPQVYACQSPSTSVCPCLDPRQRLPASSLRLSVSIYVCLSLPGFPFSTSACFTTTTLPAPIVLRTFNKFPLYFLNLVWRVVSFRF